MTEAAVLDDVTAGSGGMQSDEIAFEGDLEQMIATGEIDESPEAESALQAYDNTAMGRDFREAYGNRGFYKYLEIDPEVLGDDGALGAFLKTPDGKRYIAFAKDLLGKERTPRMDALVNDVISNHPVYSQLAGKMDDDNLYNMVRHDILMGVVEHEKVHDVFDRYGIVQNEDLVEEERGRFHSWRYLKNLGKDLGAKAYSVIGKYLGQKKEGLKEAVKRRMPNIDRYINRMPGMGGSNYGYEEALSNGMLPGLSYARVGYSNAGNAIKAMKGQDLMARLSGSRYGSRGYVSQSSGGGSRHAGCTGSCVGCYRK